MKLSTTLTVVNPIPSGISSIGLSTECSRGLTIQIERMESDGRKTWLVAEVEAAQVREFMERTKPSQ